MQKVELSADHRATLATYIESFKEFLSTKKGEEWDKGREDRHKVFTEKLAEEKLEALTVDDFSSLIRRLWAFAGWSPQGKEWLINEMLKDSSIEHVRDELKRLLYSEDTIEDRFDNFNIRILKGTAAKTELLNIMFPQHYGIWNDRVKRSIKFTTLNELLPERVFKPQIGGQDYVACNNLLASIREELVNRNLRDASFFEVDLFLYYIFFDFAAKTGTFEEIEEVEEIAPSISLERDLRDYLANNPHVIERELKLIQKEYKTEVGIIDLLCEDRKGRLVIVETKKGRESDKVVGQALRYMGWLKKQTGKNVRGIIILNQPDERLEYAVHATRDVRVKYYRVRFEIRDKFE